MTYTFKELKGKTAAQLKEIADGINHEAVQGHTQMNKEHLILAICKALAIDTFDHHVSKDADKSEIKSNIKILKQKRDKALEARDHKQVRLIRRRIKSFKNKLRKTVV